MSDVSIRYQAMLFNMDGESQPQDETGVYSPDIPMDTLDDQFTRESAITQMDQWCRSNGWTWTGDDDEGTLFAPDGTSYIYKIFEMRCATYKLRYLDDGTSA